MAETSGPRGPCTAPRRRCCRAWPWTATARARPRQDACPPRACRAPCRRRSTWPASTSTRTRVSAPRRARPRRSPRGQSARCVSGSSRPGRGASLCLGRSVGVRAGSAPEAGSPWDRGRGPARAQSRRRTWSLRGRSQPPRPRGEAATSRIWARKEQTSLVFLGTWCPESSHLFLGKCPRPWAPVPSPAPPLLRCGVPASPERLGVRGGRGPALGLSLRQRGGGPRETREPRLQGPRPGRTAAPRPCEPLVLPAGRGAAGTQKPGRRRHRHRHRGRRRTGRAGAAEGRLGGHFTAGEAAGSCGLRSLAVSRRGCPGSWGRRGRSGRRGKGVLGPPARVATGLRLDRSLLPGRLRPRCPASRGLRLVDTRSPPPSTVQSPRVASRGPGGRGHRPLRRRCRVGLIAPVFLRELFRNRSPGTSWTKGLCEAPGGGGAARAGSVEVPGGGARTGFWPGARGSPESWGLRPVAGGWGRLEEGRGGTETRGRRGGPGCLCRAAVVLFARLQSSGSGSPCPAWGRGAAAGPRPGSQAGPPGRRVLARFPKARGGECAGDSRPSRRGPGLPSGAVGAAPAPGA